MEPIEKKLLAKQVTLYGLDEVGRGPLAGPVVSCCCVYKGTTIGLKKLIELGSELGIGDSKKLSAAKRKYILQKLGPTPRELDFNKSYTFSLKSYELHFCLSFVDHQEIDKINILQASLKSMDLAFEKLEKKIPFCNRTGLIWVDGNKMPVGIGAREGCETIVKGDSKSFIIGIASIIAKEKRDSLMEELAKVYPQYGFEKHAGYPTKSHKEALQRFGPSPIHRLSFKGVS